MNPIPAAVLLAAAAASAGAADELAPPVRLEAGGKPIDTEIGHAAPLVLDWNGDGKRDLLVGQFGGGKLWIFRNDGTDGAPRLVEGYLFKEGAPEATVPTG